MHGKDALHADAVGDLAHREGLADPCAAPRNADAFERLEPLLVAFLHAYVHAQRVARPERGDGLEPLFLGFDEGVHDGGFGSYG